jgi:putative transposase
MDNRRLAQRIAQLHHETRESYGVERLWHALRQQGEVCGRHRVRHLRHEHAIQSRRRRRYVRTRSTYQRAPVAPNRLAWPLISPGPDRIWVANITYVLTQQGWLYLAAVLDMYSRRIVGWAMGERADQTLASNALAMALARRHPPQVAIHHSDQGSTVTKARNTPARAISSSYKRLACSSA